MNIKTFVCLAVILPLVSATSAFGVDAGTSKPFLSPLFADGMVLQRDLKNPVWGWTTPGSKITVSVCGLQASTVADAAGRWQANLGPLKAGGPFTMTVTGEKSVSLKNILVGDVWICSGQSNMDFATAGSINGQEEVAEANHPQIRLFKVSQATADTPLDVVSGDWKVCSPATVGNFSAAGYFFGRKLNQDLQVPIGLIHTAWGGTVAEAWTSAEALGKLDDFKTPLAQAAAQREKYRDVNPDQALADWYRSNDPGTAHEWFRAEADSSTWKEVTLPATLENLGLGIFEGIVWFQRSFDAPSAWAGKDLTLEVGQADDIDTTWCNGVLVGTTDGWEKVRRYTIPGSVVKAGRNVIAVRLLNPVGSGGLIGPAENMRVFLAADPGMASPLTGTWRMQTSARVSEMTPRPGAAGSNPNALATLYNGMIAPLTPLAIKGVIWYQGEANVGRGLQYRALLPALINDWRARFSGGAFGFHIVSLANFLQTTEHPSESAWAELREAQAMTAKTLPDCGLAQAIDVGEANDIHPKNKQEVGRRLALDAEALTYGAKDVEWSGPWYDAMKIEGSNIRLTFDHLGGGLVAKDGPLKGFAIAGADRNFVWADAMISGDSVVVSASGVPQPVAVRYAWGDNPICNLYNKAGLPAVPFRTDSPPSKVAPPIKTAVTVRSLLQEMVDRDRLPQLPKPSYVAGQASSYDRQKVAPDQPGWFANHDYGQYVRTEMHGGRKEYVMMDVDGPGAIIRWWEGDHADTAVIRIYLDGADTPTVGENILTLLSGTGRIKPPLAAVKSLGLNSYFPIPYATHCKVTYDKPRELHWYDIGYRTYPKGTLVETYSRAEDDAAQDELDRIQQELSRPNEVTVNDTKQRPAISGTLSLDGTLEASIDGPAAIRQLAVTVKPDDPADLSAALRSTVLSIEFDDQPTVWVPVGDFFGSGVGLNPYHDRYREVRGDGTMVCWWVMPFAKNCHLQLKNFGQKPVHVALDHVVVSPWSWDDRSMLFYSAWREEYPIQTKRQEGVCDWNYVTVEGQGVYVGDTLSIHNGSSAWWGEGDEKVWVDEDRFPSILGTGTEDYYGYSYGDRGVFFEAPFHAEPRWEGNRQPGYVTNTRTRSLDAIPFDRRLEFNLEVWHKEATTMEYAVTTYWYARPGSTHNGLPEITGAVRPLIQDRG